VNERRDGQASAEMCQFATPNASWENVLTKTSANVSMGGKAPYETKLFAQTDKVETVSLQMSVIDFLDSSEKIVQFLVIQLVVSMALLAE
jgi:hypothetical protein